MYLRWYCANIIIIYNRNSSLDRRYVGTALSTMTILLNWVGAGPGGSQRVAMGGGGGGGGGGCCTHHVAPC